MQSILCIFTICDCRFSIKRILVLSKMNFDCDGLIVNISNLVTANQIQINYSYYGPNYSIASSNELFPQNKSIINHLIYIGVILGVFNQSKMR